MSLSVYIFLFYTFDEKNNNNWLFMIKLFKSLPKTEIPKYLLWYEHVLAVGHMVIVLQ